MAAWSTSFIVMLQEEMAADRELTHSLLENSLNCSVICRGKIFVWCRSDGDTNAARGSVRVLTAATYVEQQLQVDRAQAALQHAHPLALLYRHDGASNIGRNDGEALVSSGFATPGIRSNSGSAWAPMTKPLPHGIHLFGLGTPLLYDAPTSIDKRDTAST
jgi:hypothetical protein